MKRFSKITLIGLTLALTACGFKPMHAPTAFGGTGYAYEEISVVALENNKEDFLLKQALRERMGTHTNTKYKLSVDPKMGRINLGVGSDDVASRYDLVMTTKIVLRDAKTNKALYADTIRAVSTFGAPRDPYGTVSAEANATEQVSAETADRILNRVAAYFQKQGRAKPES